MSDSTSASLSLTGIEEARTLFGIHDRHLKLLRGHFPVEIIARDGEVRVEGEQGAVGQVLDILRELLRVIRAGGGLDADTVESLLPKKRGGSGRCPQAISGRADKVEPRTPGQRRYMKKIAGHDLTFSFGPAGTGKTFLAVVMAVRALAENAVERIILCRPAVEAGEKLGFLPGDIFAKVNPYLRPLYDALHSLLDYDSVKRFIEHEVIEIVPLAYMRGRTLNNAFIILDEAQNTTRAQMLMFLTRMGEGSKIVVTGDVTQIDLPPHTHSGLVEARRVLASIPGIAFHELLTQDIVRHPLVWKIVDAYEGRKSGGR